MPEAFSATTFHRSSPIFVVPAANGTWRLPDRRKVEQGMARAFDAIRHYARIAWWDGSSVGLHLHGYVGMFGFAEADFCAGRHEDTAEGTR